MSYRDTYPSRSSARTRARWLRRIEGQPWAKVHRLDSGEWAVDYPNPIRPRESRGQRLAPGPGGAWYSRVEKRQRRERRERCGDPGPLPVTGWTRNAADGPNRAQ